MKILKDNATARDFLNDVEKRIYDHGYEQGITEGKVKADKRLSKLVQKLYRYEMQLKNK